jgi:proteasome accessory factor C
MTSPRTAGRLTRILAMLPWVIANPGAAVDEVCVRFGYTRAELVQDLNLVFVCGLPGYGPGDLMTAYVDEDEVVVDTAEYFSEPLRLTATEGLALLAGGMAVISSGVAPEALASAVAKLQAVLLPEPGTIDVDVPAEPELVAILRDAATDGTVVEITHTSIAGDRTTVRKIEPWSVFSTLGNWYVSAHCRLADAERVFRIDRIRSAGETNETFTPPTTPPPPEVRYTPGVDDVTAVIRLHPGAEWVTEYYPVEILKQDADGTVIEFRAADPLVAARLLVRLGEQADLVTGQAVATACDRLRYDILTRYGVTKP